MTQSPFNLSEEVVSQLTWMNKPESFTISENALTITALEGSDFFNNPEDGSIVGSAPYLYQTTKENFIAKALIQPDFSSKWNAVSLMVHMDSLNWIKFAFENSDATGPSIVSVVTKGTSDDANGVILNEADKIWLAIARKDHLYALHWSADGESYQMARLTSMPKTDIVKIGIEAQSPVGEQAIHTIHFFEVTKTTIDDLRALP